MAILQRIQALSEQLADSEAKVAHAVLADPRLLEHYTITSLAQHADTSTSAVLRFCHSLGFAGFKDFRYELNAELQQSQRTGDSAQDPLAIAAEGLAQAIRQLSTIDRAALDLLAAQIAAAPAVLCVGIHRSALPAAKLRMDLEDLGILALLVGSTVHATHVASVVGEQSCTVVFSESGAQSSYRPALDAGLTAQGHSWVITSNPRPQLAAQVEHVITLPSAKRAGAGFVDEHAVAMAFVELLVLTLKERVA